MWDSDQFSITYEETVGRNGVAMTDINFGDILLVDKPIVMRNKVGKQFCTHCSASLQRKQVYKSPFGGEGVFCSLDCFESKIDFGKIFPGRLQPHANEMLLPLRLITQKPLQYFQEKQNTIPERHKRYGCGSDFSAVDGYACVESMVTHYEEQSVTQQLGLAINTLILHTCLCAMEYLPSIPLLQDLNLAVTVLLHNYILAARLVIQTRE